MSLQPFSIIFKTKNNLLPKHVFNPSSIQVLLQKESSPRPSPRHIQDLLQDACINFRQQFTQNELLLFLDSPDNQHP